MLSLEYNNETYNKLLRALLQENARVGDKGDVYSELVGMHTYFMPDALISGTNKKYVANELDWYLSQDLSIIGHKGIEENPIWKKCATIDGHINSNYGWCIFSNDNGNQFDFAVKALLNNKDTRQAVMIYTRPAIHVECCDGEHARYDMICTCYTSTLIRNNTLIHNVHMRSNDVWYGLRNDLAWQQWVQKAMFDKLKNKYTELELGMIIWNADSLHLYKNSVDKVKEHLKKYE